MADKILISGITGFVGSNLAPHLGNSYSVKGISRTEGVDEDIISYSALKREGMHGYKAFVHLAGKAHDLKKTSSEKEYFEGNTDLTRTLFDQFLDSDCETFIYMSSVKAVADTVDGALDENATPNPITAYGKSKLEAEKYLLSKELPPNKYLYILRPAMIHGPKNKGNLNLLYQVVRRGVPYPLGAFGNQRSFVSVDNLCFIIQQLIEKKPGSGVYHIADDEALSTVELVKTIGKAAEKKTRILNLPKRGIKGLARIGDVLHLPFTTERLEKLTENYVVSNMKLKDALEIELPLTAREGIQKTVKSFENREK